MNATRLRHGLTIVLGLLALLAGSNAWAIPSPDLVINLSASVAQLVGLVSVLFGGVAMRRKARGAKRGARGGTPRMFFGVALICLMASLAINAIQYTSAIDAKNARLHTNLVRKSVENGQNVGDISLKTLSFSEQLTHPQGIATETLAEWLDSDVPVNLIDVREDEEYESGAIEGTRHLRYPDLLASSSLLPDSDAQNARTILLCYSGNRSSELCENLTAQGKSCNFMVGGYEKWLTESRPLNSSLDSSAEELRQLPHFPNKDVLLDTPEVQTMVAEEGAEFVDVRYPSDFVKGHLPGAHNITMRALGSNVLADRVAELPDDTPLIAACYDKRSCFYSTLIGLRMTRAGKDFRGRYTVPHEYYARTGSSDRAHVANWRASKEQLTLASYIVTPATSLVNSLAGMLGHPIITLLALVLLIRVALFPLAVKAERDTRVQKSLKYQISQIKQKFQDDAREITRETMNLLRTHRVRPIFSLINSMLQLGATLLFYSAVNGAAANWEGSFLWADTASTPDPLRIVPLAATLLFAAAICIQVSLHTTRRRIGMGAGLLFLFGLMQALGIAVTTYLALSMAALVVQTVIIARLGNVRGWDTRGKQEADEHRVVEDTGIITLADAHKLPDSAGRKAARLAEMIEAGFDVPPGFVITESLIGQSARNQGNAKPASLSQAQRAQLSTAWKSLNAKKVAVRSSGANEDGADNSFAGVYDSILNVEREGVWAAASKVYSSLDSARSTAYRGASSESEVDTGGVLVQAMVDAEYAGVMFTEHPSTSGSIMIEVVAGLGEDLVSGSVTPDSYQFGKISGELHATESADKPPIDFSALLELGRRLETLFDAPQDIEWAYAKGRFHLLQARDITRSVTSGSHATALVERERARLIKELTGRRQSIRKKSKETAQSPLLVQSELSELLPRPTPLSADLMRRLWEADGATDIACQELGVPYAVQRNSVPFVTTLFGWTYVNRQEEARRVGKGPGAMAAFRLSRDADAMEEAFNEEFLPQFRADMIERNAISFNDLQLDTAVALLDTWVERFVKQTYVEAERINIAASMLMSNAREKLTKAKIDPATVLGADADSIAAQAMALLTGGDVSEQSVEDFLMMFGHRAPLDYELSHPRFNEDERLVQSYIERSSMTAHTSTDVKEVPGNSRILKITVERARRFQTLKEDAKHYSLIELAQIRKLLMAIDHIAGLDGRVFQLTLDEVLSLGHTSSSADLLVRADKRVADSLAWAQLQAPVSLTLHDLERMNLSTGELPSIDSSSQSVLKGSRVAGDGKHTGRARVIVDASAIDTFQEGEILVARMTDPTWYPLFGQASGIVTEIGGWLSHAAIVAREFGLPTIVGAVGATTKIKTGDIVTLDVDGSVEVQTDQRNNDPVQAAEKPADTGNVHILSELRRFRYSAIERRSMKSLIGDRRSEVRVDANGEPLPGRRASDRAANLSVYRKAA